jgi:hypothetical protein
MIDLGSLSVLSAGAAALAGGISTKKKRKTTGRKRKKKSGLGAVKAKKKKTTAKKRSTPATSTTSKPKRRRIKTKGRSEKLPRTIKVSGQTGKSKTAADKKRTALKPGKRKSRSGKIYYETRKNRSDVNPRVRL